MLEPMYATIGADIPQGADWAFEPKYDGIRVLAFITPGSAALVTRNGKQKSNQFPEIVRALRTLAARRKGPLVLDGEIVALRDGGPARFQELQARMHVTDRSAIELHAERSPAALIVFDLLVDGDDVLVNEPWSVRRRRLEKRVPRNTAHLRLGDSVVGGGEKLLARARASGWEGVIAKRRDAVYEPGRRSRAWRKLKVEHRQELVVGGYTEPRNTREYIGALLLGYYQGDRFIYAGHTGGGFTRESLREMYERLRPLELASCPFDRIPRTNAVAHWVRPEVVVEVKFNEWTADGKLRQPIFLGIRDDKAARDVARETESMQRRSVRRQTRRAAAARSDHGQRGRPPAARKKAEQRRSPKAESARKQVPRKPTSARARPKRPARGKRARPSPVAQLEEIERTGGDGVLELEGGSLAVSSLDKIFFPDRGYTKGDVMRYYARIAPVILPLLADRPLVLKRFPNGIGGASFFQQNTGGKVPQDVRVGMVSVERGGKQPRFIGGDLITLLYTVQIGCISADPWHSRLQSLDQPDYTILDLDPGPKASFRRVIEVARLVKAEMDALGLHGALKTSGSTGMHVYAPLPEGSTYDLAVQLAESVARRVATGHPSLATVERTVAARPPESVYVDYQQNVRGKSVASAFAARAKPGATVSMPVAWDALRAGLAPSRFTISTVPPRARAAGHIWSRAMERPVGVGRALRRKSP